MRRLATLGLLLVAAGCAAGPSWYGPTGQPMTPSCGNPMLVRTSNPEYVWEIMADVIDDYFRIEREVPVRVLGNEITEGRLDTFPSVGSTIFEPWHSDSANSRERIECTLQSIRRWAVVRVIPDECGYLVDVAVFKELEDVQEPLEASAGAATLRYDHGLTRVVNPVGEQEIHAGWILQGRDAALEQRILCQLQARFSNAGLGRF